MPFCNEDNKGLIKLFGSEPEVYDPDSFVYTYRKSDDHGYSLELYSLLVEEHISLNLEHLNNPFYIYTIRLYFVERVKAFENGFIISFFNYPIQGYVYFFPNFSLKLQFRESTIRPNPINYDLVELKALFKKQSINTTANQSEYNFEIQKANYIFHLYFSPVQNHVTISLKDIHLKFPLYKISINDVLKIEGSIEKPERLLIQQYDNEELLQVIFAPFFFLNMGTPPKLNEINEYRKLIE